MLWSMVNEIHGGFMAALASPQREDGPEQRGAF